MKSIQNIMRDILSQPTAPYRENWVLNQISSELNRLKVPFFTDSWGNIVAGVQSKNELVHSKRVALVAHTDHPGFHLVRKIKGTTWLAQWYGGVPPKTKGAHVGVFNPKHPGQVVKGKIISPHFFGKSKNLFHILIQKEEFSLDRFCFGAFLFPGFKKRGHRIITRAADDLAGVTIILATLARLKKKERSHFLGVFTRAEEVGFRGALGLIYSKALGRHTKAISLEASRQLEGARIGLGPVIRLGDKRTLFDTGVTSGLDEAAKSLSKRRNFKVQRRIMNGGTCEATALNLYNTKASGLAIPLGNYHNQRSNGKPGPEFVDFRDVERAVELCVEFFKQKSKGFDSMVVLEKNLSSGFRRDSKNLKIKVKYNYEI